MKAEHPTLELRDLFDEIAAATMSEMSTRIIHLTEELRAERERADKAARERDEALARLAAYKPAKSPVALCGLCGKPVAAGIEPDGDGVTYHKACA